MNDVKQTQWPVLRAMAKNYADGHRWDHLDGEAVTKAADEIIALTDQVASLRQHKTDYMEAAEQTRQALAADNKRLREALATAGKGVHWMQAHVPMTEKAQWKAYETRRVIEAALAGSKEGE